MYDRVPSNDNSRALKQKQSVQAGVRCILSIRASGLSGWGEPPRSSEFNTCTHTGCGAAGVMINNARHAVVIIDIGHSPGTYPFEHTTRTGDRAIVAGLGPPGLRFTNKHVL